MQEESEGGINFITYDGAMRGKHIKKLMNKGIIPITPINGHTKSKNVCKSQCKTCGFDYEIIMLKGSLFFREIIDTGEKYNNEIIYKIKRNKDKNKYRFYAVFNLECGHSSRLLLNGENSISFLDSFKPLYKTSGDNGVYNFYRGLRQDAESFNNLIERKHHARQSVGYSRNSQYLNMLAHGILNNARCSYLYEQL